MQIYFYFYMHSVLVLEVKGLKPGYVFKNIPFYISFVLKIFHFQAGLNIPRKKVMKKKKFPIYVP